MENVRDARAEQVDISDQRHMAHLVSPHVSDQFALLASIETDLIDDVFRSAANLRGQLRVLRHDLALTELEIGRDGSDQKICAVKQRSLSTAERIVRIESGVHLI